MFRHFASHESVRFAFLVHRPPFLAQLVCALLSLYFRLAYLPMVPLTPRSWSLSNSVPYFHSSLLLLVHHLVALLFFLLYIDQRLRPATVAHSFLDKRCVQPLFLHYFFKLFHRFILLICRSVSFQGVFLSKSMFFFLNFVVCLLNFGVDFRSQILFNLHAFHLKKKILFFLKFLKFFPNIWIHKISDVFAVIYFRNYIILPLFGNHVMLLKWNAENTSTALLLLQLPDSFLFLSFFAQIYLYWQPLYIVSFLRLSDVHPINVILLSFNNFRFRLRKLNVKN